MATAGDHKVTRDGSDAAGTGPGAGLAATRILDHGSPAVRAALARLGPGTPADRLRAAARAVGRDVRAVYAVDEHQPAGVTLARGEGSCSQRLAAVEALARADGIPTRVRGYRVDGAFWRARFAVPPATIPDVTLAWPEFWVDGRWTDLDALRADDPAASGTCTPAPWTAAPFTNAGRETLFEAALRGGADLAGLEARGVAVPLGVWASRDALFAARGRWYQAGAAACAVRGALQVLTRGAARPGGRAALTRNCPWRGPRLAS